MRITSLQQSLNDSVTTAGRTQETNDQALVNTARMYANPDSDTGPYLLKWERYLIAALDIIYQRGLGYKPEERAWLASFNKKMYAIYQLPGRGEGLTNLKERLEGTTTAEIENPDRRKIGNNDYEALLPWSGNHYYPYDQTKTPKVVAPTATVPSVKASGTTPTVVTASNNAPNNNIKRYAVWGLVAIGAVMVYRAMRK